MFTNKKKIALVGTGMVGMSFAYAALNQNLCDELVLIDINEQRARGEAMDLNHGIAFSPASTKIYAGNYSDCKDAVSYTHLTLPTNRVVCRSRWSPDH